ncbi:ABC transporter substrate-binding protein [Iodidimonas sp. SYSU 1G8]|uniref:ABC transporter substrate-binding protein n=1 Tax=Iodidimonas sp. SYSU 1G8 TaxID=3133967 RepID=UPI0031FE7823
MRDTSRLAVAIGVAVATLCGGASALPRVASTTICGDQLVLTLADRAQIASVSQEATGPLSLHADEAAGLPRNRKTAEELLGVGADVVLMDARGEPKLEEMLTRLGIRVIRLNLSSEFADIEETVMHVAEAFGQRARGLAMVADMRRRRAAVAATVPPGPRPRFVYYRPDGGSAGLNTFVDTAMRASGFDNFQADRGQVGWGTLPLEVLVNDPPDGFVVSFFDTSQSSIRRTFMTHAYLHRLMDEKPVIGVPGKLWPCAGPMVVDAAELLASERVRGMPEERP